MHNGTANFCTAIENEVSAFKREYREPSAKELTRLSKREVSAFYDEGEIWEYNRFIRMGAKEGDLVVFSGENTFTLVKRGEEASGQGSSQSQSDPQKLEYADSWKRGPFEVMPDDKISNFLVSSEAGALGIDSASTSPGVNTLTVLTAPHFMLELKGVDAICGRAKTRAGELPDDLASKIWDMTGTECAKSLGFGEHCTRSSGCLSSSAHGPEDSGSAIVGSSEEDQALRRLVAAGPSSYVRVESQEFG